MITEYNILQAISFNKYDRILVKANVKGAVWQVALFDSYNEDNPNYPFRTVDNRNFAYAIPFEGNEELIGTSYNSLDEATNPYKFGDIVGIKYQDSKYTGIYVAKSTKCKGRHLVVLEPRLCDILGIRINLAIRAIEDETLTKD